MLYRAPRPAGMSADDADPARGAGGLSRIPIGGVYRENRNEGSDGMPHEEPVRKRQRLESENAAAKAAVFPEAKQVVFGNTSESLAVVTTGIRAQANFMSDWLQTTNATTGAVTQYGAMKDGLILAYPSGYGININRYWNCKKYYGGQWNSAPVAGVAPGVYTGGGYEFKSLVPAATAAAVPYLAAWFSPVGPPTYPSNVLAYALLAGTSITNTGVPTITGGNIGSATSAITGTYVLNFPSALDNADAGAAVSAFTPAISFAYPNTTVLTSADMGTQNVSGLGVGVYAPGNYHSATTLAVTTPIILSGAGGYVFVGTSITQALAGKMTLINGATAANVVWIATSTTFTSTGAATTVGNILANTSITLGGGTLVGRALATTSITVSAALAVTVPQSAHAVVQICDILLPVYKSDGCADAVNITPVTGMTQDTVVSQTTFCPQTYLGRIVSGVVSLYSTYNVATIPTPVSGTLAGGVMSSWKGLTTYDANSLGCYSAQKDAIVSISSSAGITQQFFPDVPDRGVPQYPTGVYFSSAQNRVDTAGTRFITQLSLSNYYTSVFITPYFSDGAVKYAPSSSLVGMQGWDGSAWTVGNTQFVNVSPLAPLAAPHFVFYLTIGSNPASTPYFGAGTNHVFECVLTLVHVWGAVQYGTLGGTPVNTAMYTTTTTDTRAVSVAFGGSNTGPTNQVGVDVVLPDVQHVWLGTFAFVDSCIVAAPSGAPVYPPMAGGQVTTDSYRAAFTPLIANVDFSEQDSLAPTSCGPVHWLQWNEVGDKQIVTFEGTLATVNNQGPQLSLYNHESATMCSASPAGLVNAYNSKAEIALRRTASMVKASEWREQLLANLKNSVNIPSLEEQGYE